MGAFHRGCSPPFDHEAQADQKLPVLHIAKTPIHTLRCAVPTDSLERDEVETPCRMPRRAPLITLQ